MSMMFDFSEDMIFKKPTTMSRKIGKTMADKKKERVMEKVKTFTADQKKAFDILIDENQNWIYLVGAAGTGKSYSLTVAIDYMRNIENKFVSVCATTGCAARLLDACTAHKLFQFPCDILYDEGGHPKTKSHKKIWRSDVIIIDEISMARADLLSAVISSIKASNKKRAKLGKKPIKLILCGDPCQLPAIMSPEDKAEIERRLKKKFKKDFNIGEGWFFDAPEWKEIGFRCIELKEIMRQKGNDELTENLNRVRLGDGSWTNWFNENCSLEIDNPPEDAIRLFPYNRQVREYNKKKIESMAGELKVYTAELEGVTKEEVEENGFDYELKLKPGCLVMIKSNPYAGAEWCELMGVESDYWSEYFGNGTTGIYRGTLEDVKGEYLFIDIPNDKGGFHYLKLYRRVFDTYDYIDINDGIKKVRTGNTFTCFPCVLSFAVSVHKSQGSSLRSVVLDPKSFASGMLYVALSRVKSANPKDIYLTDFIRPEYAILSDEVKEFLKEIDGNQ